MINLEASHTAIAAAYLRAAHQLLDTQSLILNDPIAIKLLGHGAEKRIVDEIERYKTPEASSLRARVVLRSRFAEDQLAVSVTRGVGQYIIVGAGFDTFSLRQPKWASTLKIIEVDHPDTQRLKRAYIKDAAIPIPGNVTFADINFENESLLEGLCRNGVSSDIPTFFSWLGVTMYLTEAAIDATLNCMANYSKAPEAVITFLQRRSTKYQSKVAERVAQAGEPFVSYFTPEAFRAKLRSAGFGNVEFLTPERAATYFQQPENSLPPPTHISVAYAARC